MWVGAKLYVTSTVRWKTSCFDWEGMDVRSLERQGFHNCQNQDQGALSPVLSLALPARP